MLRKFISIMATSLAIVMAFACEQEEPVKPDNSSEAKGATVRCSICCEPLDTELEESTKSSHTATALTKITNVNYYLFDSYGTLRSQGYFGADGVAPISDFAIELPDAGETYRLYLIANFGKYSISNSTKESALGTLIHMDYKTFDQYQSTINSNGFPMALMMTDFTVNSGGTLKMKRLVHTLYVKVNTKELNTTEMEVKSVFVRNAALDVYPFMNGGSKGSRLADGDYASSEDITAINNGEQITLYLLENMRGEVFKGNTDWKKKVPDNLTNKADEDLCSYIDILTSAKTATSDYNENHYRAYIGTSAADCDAQRHSYTTLNNNFVSDNMVTEDWRMEPDDPIVREKLIFTSSSSSTSALSSTGSYPGFKREFYIYRSNPDIEYTLEATANSRMRYTTEEINSYYTKVILSNTESWNTNSGTRTSEMTLTLTSSDGLITSSINCIVYKEPFEMSFKVDEEGTNPFLHMAVDNELGLKFNVDISGTVGYHNIIYGNGTKKDPTATYIGNFSYHSGTDGYIYPQSGVYQRIETYANNYSSSPVTFSNYEQAALHASWSYGGYSSYNWYGGDNTYYKAATINDISMIVTVKYGKDASGTLYPASASTTIPVTISNLGLSRNSSTGIYTGGGTDFGFYLDQSHLIDLSSAGYSDVYNFDNSYFNDRADDSVGGILVAVNGENGYYWQSGYTYLNYLGY